MFRLINQSRQLTNNLKPIKMIRSMSTQVECKCKPATTELPNDIHELKSQLQLTKYQLEVTKSMLEHTAFIKYLLYAGIIGLSVIVWHLNEVKNEYKIYKRNDGKIKLPYSSSVFDL